MENPVLKNLPKVGIRPTIDGRLGGVRESLEKLTMDQAREVANLIGRNLKYPDGKKVGTALVGTRDLGQEVYIALAKADVGRGLVAGLSVAFIAIIADRLLTAGARRLRRRLGLAEESAA